MASELSHLIESELKSGGFYGEQGYRDDEKDEVEAPHQALMGALRVEVSLVTFSLLGNSWQLTASSNIQLPFQTQCLQLHWNACHVSFNTHSLASGLAQRWGKGFA